MWSRRFTEARHSVRGLVAVAVLALAAGCASQGPRSTAESRAGDAVPSEVTPEARTMYEQAVSVLAAGDLLDAELRFQEFLLRYPDVPGAHVNLAIIHAANGNDAQARLAVDSALAVDPGFAPALNQLGLLLRRNGKFLEAEAAYLKAVTASPDYALAHYNLGVLNELYLQRFDAALQHFERYQEIAGEDPEVEKWITDLERRVAAAQRTANVAE